MNKYGKLILISAVLIFSLAKFTTAQTGDFSSEENLKEDLKSNVCESKERLEAVKKLFKKMGATDEDIKTENLKDVENLVVTKPGKSKEIVVVGAHYDKTNDGCGAIDNWTGIVIIANLYKTLKNFSTEKTYLFVAFGKEEQGLVGSNAMAKAIPKEDRGNYCWMINLDSFGFAYPQVLENASSSKMTKAAKELAKKSDLKMMSAAVVGADADSSSFLNKDIPAVTFHGLNGKWQEYLHSSRDKLSNINTQSVYVGYRFTFGFLAGLDKNGCGYFRN